MYEHQSNPSHSQTVPPGREEALPHTEMCVCEGAEQTDMKDNSRGDVTNTRHKGVDPPPVPNATSILTAVWSSNP